MVAKLPVELGCRFEEDGVEYFVCSVLNNRALVSVPVSLVEHVQKAAEIDEILWPLGAYVIFGLNELTLAIFGRSRDQVVHRGGNFGPEDLGAAFTSLWQKLRGTPSEVLQENLKQLVHETHMARGTCKDLTPESLIFFQGEYVRLAAEVMGVSRSRVRARLFFIEAGYVMVDLYLDGVLIDPSEERHRATMKEFDRYLSTAKPN